MKIVDNKKAFYSYFIEEQFEAGLVLEGWEVSSIRSGKVQIKESYVSIMKNNSFFLIGSYISPLLSVSKHIFANPTRSRKLLLNTSEINKIINKVKRHGYTLVPLNFHFSNNRIKCTIGIAKGKKIHDKRQSAKDRDWNIERSRLLKQMKK